jgi:hypothetical protein
MDPENFAEFFSTVLQAVQSKNYALLAALGVIAVVWAARKFGGSKFPALKTAKAAILLTLATSLAGAVGAALLAGTPLSLKLGLDALGIAFAAAGGYRAFRVLAGFADAEAIKADAKAAGAEAASKFVPKNVFEIIKGDKE